MFQNKTQQFQNKKQGSGTGGPPKFGPSNMGGPPKFGPSKFGQSNMGGPPKFGYQRGGRKQPNDDGFETKLLDLARVTRVSAGGKRFRFRATVVSGDKAGKVGVGVAKGADVAQAMEKATQKAKRDLITVPIINGTIAHEIYAKFSAAKVMLKPQRSGRGLVAGGTVRVVCSLAGIKNISSKILGKTVNKLNNARATIKALKKLKTLPVKHNRPIVKSETVAKPEIEIKHKDIIKKNIASEDKSEDKELKIATKK